MATSSATTSSYWHPAPSSSSASSSSHLSSSSAYAWQHVAVAAATYVSYDPSDDYIAPAPTFAPSPEYIPAAAIPDPYADPADARPRPSPKPRFASAAWSPDDLYRLEPSGSPSPSPPPAPASPRVKQEEPAADAFVFELPPSCTPSQMAPMAEVPVRATWATKEMRRMMGAFHLNPFAMHSGRGAAVAARTYAEVGPLREQPMFYEFQLELACVKEERAPGVGEAQGYASPSPELSPERELQYGFEEEEERRESWSGSPAAQLGEEEVYVAHGHAAAATIMTPAQSLWQMNYVESEQGSYSLSPPASRKSPLPSRALPVPDIFLNTAVPTVSSTEHSSSPHLPPLKAHAHAVYAHADKDALARMLPPIAAPRSLQQFGGADKVHAFAGMDALQRLGAGDALQRLSGGGDAFVDYPEGYADGGWGGRKLVSVVPVPLFYTSSRR